MDYSKAFEKKDYARIDKLNTLTDANTFSKDLKKIMGNPTSDHAIHAWGRLAGIRWLELKSEQDSEWEMAIHSPELLARKLAEEAKVGVI